MLKPLLNFTAALPLAIGIAGASVSSLSKANASADLWGGGQPSSVVIEGSGSGTAAGREVDERIGKYVQFQGIGTVFYGGLSGGQVYFAELDEPGVFSWEDALTACGHKGLGWSLPTANQVGLLYQHTETIDLYAKGVRNTQAFWYWSSTAVGDERALRVRPFDGLSQPVKKKFSARVRCVRVY